MIIVNPIFDTKMKEKTSEIILTTTDDGPVSRYLNRPVSTRISKLLVRTNITPNQMTLFCFVLAIIASLVMAQKSYWELAIGGILAHLASVLDGCDGEIARYKNRSTSHGAWLDAVLDRYADAFLILALTWHELQNHPSQLVYIVGFFALIGSFMVSYTADKYDNVVKNSSNGTSRKCRIGRDLRIFIISLGSVVNQPLIALIVLATLMNFETAKRIVTLSRDNLKAKVLKE